ncbi:MAG: F420-dependent methylenetetrahydromethanopterin dehydrogenase [Candidatus Hydrothermarchaeota archaeon]
MVVKVGVVKCGAIATSAMVDLLLDERADRKDISTRVVGSGAKMGPEEAEEAVNKILEFDPDIVIYVGPNPTVAGPKKARELLSKSGKPSLIIGDAPGVKAKEEMEKEGLGYLLIRADSMIGARREFLDPSEMAIFNGDLIKVLACTGAFNIVVEAIDGMIEAVKEGRGVELPRIVVTRDKAVEAANFSNPYAKTKAMAAYEIATKVADLDVEGCFVVQDPNKYIPIVSAGHEMLRIASKLAEEAREIEKYGDTLFRRPHLPEGKLVQKTELMKKPE